ncbi:hypothetical protein QBC34DRAFT_430615 [Podospora aff. communis PSN243]|uniref:Uncharacterized protein n=1 Tax=Podospora aff. communis PSN243 TaxID=3040156 RepID=A0AAV9G798_9PEZI|nr:hypothetical protein QBC34DRAFT_430615 [Podospora aff. communis PSN243]
MVKSRPTSETPSTPWDVKLGDLGLAERHRNTKALGNPQRPWHPWLPRSGNRIHQWTDISPSWHDSSVLKHVPLHVNAVVLEEPCPGVQSAAMRKSADKVKLVSG